MPSSPEVSSRRPSGPRPLAIALVGAAGAASLTLAPTASAGVIPESGWNLDNVTVSLDGNGSSFNPIDGSYVFGPDSDYSYQADVDNGAGEVMGIVLAKDWPIGEPPGIKIVNDDTGNIQTVDPATASCRRRISTARSSTRATRSRSPVVDHSSRTSASRSRCSRPPSAVERAPKKASTSCSTSIPRKGRVTTRCSRRSTTGPTAASTASPSRSAPESAPPSCRRPTEPAAQASTTSASPCRTDFFDPDQLATFSQGLFGPIDTQHDRPAGFFDPNTRAGFKIAEYPQHQRCHRHVDFWRSARQRLRLPVRPVAAQQHVAHRHLLG